MEAAKIGYKNLFLYAEGMPVWEELGYPIIKGPNYEAKIETAKITPRNLTPSLNQVRMTLLLLTLEMNQNM